MNIICPYDFFYNLYIKNLIPREQNFFWTAAPLRLSEQKNCPCLHSMLLNKEVFPAGGPELSSSHQSSSATGCMYKWDSQKPRFRKAQRALFIITCH